VQKFADSFASLLNGIETELKTLEVNK